MNPSSGNKNVRIDPLLDADRQASELDAQSSTARPGVALRAAVLAHARVVAQSATSSQSTLAVSEAVRATPAANEAKPVWRMVAGVLLGLSGMWIYQLTRPGISGEANVAVLAVPAAAKVTNGTLAETATPATPAVSMPAATAESAGERAIPVASGNASDTRTRTPRSVSQPAASEPVVVADATQSTLSAATAPMATDTARQKRAESSASVVSAPVAAAPPEAAGLEPLGTEAVASVERRKIAARSAVMSQGAVIEVSEADQALFSAVRAGNINGLRAALGRGANVNARDATGRTALQIARERGDDDMLKALDLAGAK